MFSSDREVRGEVHLLVDHGDAPPAGVEGPRRPVGPAVELHRARVGLVGAAQDLEERALARAVLADQGVDLARRDLERDRLSACVAPKDLLIPAEAQPRAGFTSGIPRAAGG